MLWLAGSVAAIGVAWTGVSFVDDELVDPAPATNLPGSDVVELASLPDALPTTTSSSEAGETEGEIDRPPVTTTLAPAETTSASTVGVERTTTSAAPPRPERDVGGPSAAPPPTVGAASDAPTAPSGTPSVAPPEPPSSPTVPVATTVPPPPPPASSTSTSSTSVASAPAQTLTFHLVGGTTAVSFSPQEVTVLWASPNPGFGVELYYEGSGMKVDFRSNSHRSRIEVWWANGPQHDIDEDANERGGNDVSDADAGNGFAPPSSEQEQTRRDSGADRTDNSGRGNRDDLVASDNSGPGNADDRDSSGPGGHENDHDDDDDDDDRDND